MVDVHRIMTYCYFNDFRILKIEKHPIDSIEKTQSYRVFTDKQILLWKINLTES